MSGRIENEAKINRSIENNLAMMPDFVSDWHNNLISSDKTAATRRDYVEKVYNFLIFINGDCRKITGDDINERTVTGYYNSIKKKTELKNGKEYIIDTSVSYRLTVWFCLNNFLGYLYKRGIIEMNYMDFIDKPKDKNAKIKKDKQVFLTEEDFESIIAEVKSDYRSRRRVCGGINLKTRDLCIIYVFMLTGMRRTALSEINVDDLDMDSGKLIIIDKGGIEHEYYLTKDVIDVIKKWLEERDRIVTINRTHSQALFVNQEGNRISGTSLYNLVEGYCKSALGKEVSPHKLRAGFCSILYEKTGDIEFVRRAVGHSNIATTQRYIVTKGDERKQASSMISSLLKKS